MPLLGPRDGEVPQQAFGSQVLIVLTCSVMNGALISTLLFSASSLLSQGSEVDHSSEVTSSSNCWLLSLDLPQLDRS